jgi:hypothetical protein
MEQTKYRISAFASAVERFEKSNRTDDDYLSLILAVDYFSKLSYGEKRKAIQQGIIK